MGAAAVWSYVFSKYLETGGHFKILIAKIENAKKENDIKHIKRNY